MLTSDCFNPQETGCQAGSWEGVRNIEIVAISNQYKDTLDDLIDSSDLESLDWVEQIDKKSRNAPMSEGSSADLSEKDCLDEDLPDRSSQLAPKTENLQVRQRRIIAPRAGYWES